MMRVLAILVTLTVTASCWALTPAEFLAGPQGEPAVEDLGPGEPFVIEGGMHEGHQSLRWPAMRLDRTDPVYGLNYGVCLDREAHPRMVEVWPRESGVGLGLSAPTSCNFYSGGSFDVQLDGVSVGPWKARIERLIWDDASGYRYTWKMPGATVSVDFIGRDKSDFLLMRGRVVAEDFVDTISVSARCFPSSFAEPRERAIVTGEAEFSAGASVMLKPTSPWAFFMDQHFDEALLPGESRGPCALLFNPEQVQRATVEVGEYQVATTLELAPGQTEFSLALWEFPDVANADALTVLRERVSALDFGSASVELVEAAPRVLVRDGRPAATLVLPAEPTQAEETAALDLQAYLQQMSGAYLPVARGEIPERGNRVFMGAVAGYEYPDDVPAGRAGFTLRTDGRDIFIRGEDDFATLYGACELMEKLGVRWVLPGRIGEVVPEMATVVVPKLDETQRPDFAMRWIGRSEWSYRNKCNGSARSLPRGFNVQPGIYHSQYRFMSTKQYFAEHPDWFALIDGERCDHKDAKPCTTNPEVIRQTAANMAAMLDADPTIDMVSLAYTDGSYYCQCPNCVALDEPGVPKDQSMSRRTLIFYNAVADELMKTHPEAKILAGAYHVYNRPPADPDLKAHPALSLVLCHYTTYCNLHPVNDPTCPPNVAYDKLLRDWQRLIPNVYFYEYYYTDGWRNFPGPLVHAIRSDIPYFRELGCGGLYTQYGLVWNHFLNYYIAGKLLWDADADVDALLADLYEKFFGPAREPMARYYTALIDAIGGSKEHMCLCSLVGHDPRLIFTEELMADLREWLTQAQALAADDRMVTARLRKVAASQEYAERFIEYLNLRDVALAEPPGQKRHELAVQALEAIESLHDEIAADRRKWEGISGPGSYHWRYDLRSARKLAEPPPLPVGEKLRDLPLKWRFALDPEGVGVGEEWFAADFDDAGWAELNVGQYWEAQGHADYDGIAWYRLAVELTEADLAEPLLIGFEGVDAEAWVYLNGREIGRHDGWDEPFAVRVPADVGLAGAENLIAVRVFDSSNNGGIYGRITLARPK
jgi:hypothetical protein